MTLKFKIVTVDPYGFNGRDNHPEKSDIGLIVSPIRMAVDIYDEEDSYVAPTDETIIAAVNNTAIDGIAIKAGPLPMICWTCVTADGRLLDLMDFEVELHSAGSANGMTYRAPVELGGAQGLGPSTACNHIKQERS